MNKLDAQSVLRRLREAGISISEGFSNDELNQIESCCNVILPPDFRELLNYGFPRSNGFYDWREALIRNIVEEGKERLRSFPEFELHEDFENAPPLLPLLGHRFLPCEPSKEGNPVFSIWGLDTIIYGPDLLRYLLIETGLEDFKFKDSDCRYIRFWSDLLWPEEEVTNL